MVILVTRALLSGIMNVELKGLYDEDQAARQRSALAATWVDLSESDAARRRRVAELIAAGAVEDADDNFHAAMVYQHGESLADIWRAHTLAEKAAALGHPGATWLTAAALDRWHMYQGRPQPYGTQFISVEGRWQLVSSVGDSCDISGE